jgi:hypothetical protein
MIRCAESRVTGGWVSLDLVLRRLARNARW